MRNLKEDMKEIWKVVKASLVVVGLVMLTGWFTKLLFNQKI